MNDDESMRQARLLMAMMDSGKARIEPTDPDDGIGVAWIRVHDAIVVAVEPLAAALARAEAAESECAELNDALDAMRMTADEVQARQRGRVQAGVWAQAAAAVQAASGRPAPYPVDLYPGCPCYTCDSETWTQRKWPERMSLCPTCGNKRCPGSAHHDRHAPEEPLAAWELDLLKPLPRD